MLIEIEREKKNVSLSIQKVNPFFLGDVNYPRIVLLMKEDNATSVDFELSLFRE